MPLFRSYWLLPIGDRYDDRRKNATTINISRGAFYGYSLYIKRYHLIYDTLVMASCLRP